MAQIVQILCGAFGKGAMVRARWSFRMEWLDRRFAEPGDDPKVPPNAEYTTASLVDLKLDTLIDAEPGNPGWTTQRH